MLVFECLAIAKSHPISFTPQSNLMWLNIATSILQMRKLEFRDNKLLAESLNQQVMEKDSGPGLSVPLSLYLRKMIQGW